MSLTHAHLHNIWYNLIMKIEHLQIVDAQLERGVMTALILGFVPNFELDIKLPTIDG